MNRLHRWYCRSDHWRRTVVRDLLAWTLSGVAPDADLLELGAGSGVVTAHLLDRGMRVTPLDVAPDAAVRVRADAADLPFADRTFSSVAAFTMLHHVAGRDRRHRLLCEAKRVLRPSGTFVGCDPCWSLTMRLFHLGDTFVPTTPDRLAADLAAAGFGEIAISTRGRYLRWHARRLA